MFLALREPFWAVRGLAAPRLRLLTEIVASAIIPGACLAYIPLCDRYEGLRPVGHIRADPGRRGGVWPDSCIYRYRLAMPSSSVRSHLGGCLSLPAGRGFPVRRKGTPGLSRRFAPPDKNKAAEGALLGLSGGKA